MADEGLVIDPTSEDASNVPFDLIDGTTTFLLEAAYPPPERDQMWASSADTEGDALVQTRYRNRVITIKIRVVGASASALQTTLGQLQQKVGKVSRECGTLKRTAPSGSTIVFDLLGATSDIPIDRRHLNLNRAEVTLTFEAKPFGRGTPVTGSAHSESTLPVLVFTETGVGGDVPALGQLAVTEAQGADQWWLTWGVQSRYYDAATTAKLFYEAEDLTPLGASALNAGPSGASGSGGSKVIRSGALTTNYQALLSTQASGGGSHLTHVGEFHVYARVQTASANTGAVSVALEWAQGDFRTYTRNAAVVFPADSWDASWRLVDLGQVSPSKVVTGSQRWEGRVIAKSTVVGDTIDVDHIFLVPVTEGSGIITALVDTTTPTSLTTHDEFAQTAGNLNGKTAPVGSNWATSGDTTDLATTGGGTITRATTSDAGSGRFAVLGSSVAAITAHVDLKTSVVNSFISQGLVLRYVDASNYAVALVQLAGTNPVGLSLTTVVSGSIVTAASASGVFPGTPGADTFYTLTATVDANGQYRVWFGQQGSQGTLVIVGQHSVFASGGTLASGKFGINDRNPSGVACTRTYANYATWVPTGDAAVFASRQAAIRDTGPIRQDSAGVIWAAPSVYEGDYLIVPPAGREARTSRFIVKGCRNDPATMADPNIDDISATLTYTPRYLVVPES